MKINKNSLQSRVKKVALEKGVPSNVILQNYFFDAFLIRLSKSKYVNSFICKGGFLLSASLGIEHRSTMDIDFSVRTIPFKKDKIVNIFNEIADMSSDDYVIFELLGIDDIREDEPYGGYKVSLLAKLENIRVKVDIDVASGDPITPSYELLEYKCLLSNEKIALPSYNFETIIAEKLQTILSRGLFNSRCKDFYDVYIINKLRINQIDRIQLANAFSNTCAYRKTIFTKETALDIITSLRDDRIMNERWAIYSIKNAYASNVLFNDTIEAIMRIIMIVMKNWVFNDKSPRKT